LAVIGGNQGNGINVEFRLVGDSDGRAPAVLYSASREDGDLDRALVDILVKVKGLHDAFIEKKIEELTFLSSKNTSIVKAAITKFG
jgi:hypothetical protein